GRYPKIKVSYTPVLCMHCDDAPCIKMAQNGAVYKRRDGIVIIDPVKAKGQKELIVSCPYRVIEWNEEKQLPQKCTLCAHMLDKGEKEPRCVESCPTGALIFGDLDDPGSEVCRLIGSGKTEALHGGYNIGEKVRYMGLPGKFIAGTIIYGDRDECAEGVAVTLSRDSERREVKSNAFGDFEFEGLADNTEYTIRIAAGGYKEQSITARTQKDVYLGEITLKNL
ncbi:MAG TPA: 4Fe-4S dicluster domain-containing protein, partial [Dehalococcoidia bacterium]|nr:4Fe-4S dicluster domain-containing protein [Dehalococcoidia bacterium]